MEKEGEVKNHWVIDFLKMVVRDIKKQWTSLDTLIVFLAIYMCVMSWLIKTLLDGGKP